MFGEKRKRKKYFLLTLSPGNFEDLFSHATLKKNGMAILFFKRFEYCYIPEVKFDHESICQLSHPCAE